MFLLWYICLNFGTKIIGLSHQICASLRFKTFLIQNQDNFDCHVSCNTGLTQAGGGLVPQFLADQLTLPQSGGTLCPPHYHKPPSRFSDLATGLNRQYFKLIDPNLFSSFQPCFCLTTNVFKGYRYSSFLNRYCKRSDYKTGIKNFFLTFKIKGGCLKFSGLTSFLLTWSFITHVYYLIEV